ncbi:MAG TPA: hypothetical protein VFX97_12570 [Pyrinomonadaceae bacterium]|nr:hypothetical protein [Pyrinomonadaceae bacterium]
MRESIDRLDAQFADLHARSLDLIARLPPARLYAKPNGSADSFGEQILRSAAVVEQGFGGLTANLWDDPFEWTLPETLSDPAKVREYLDEVEVTRRSAFASFESDDDLSKEIMTPAGSTQLLPFLLDTLRRARHHHERAEIIYKLRKD